MSLSWLHPISRTFQVVKVLHKSQYSGFMLQGFLYRFAAIVVRTVWPRSIGLIC